jgi:lipid II:glycine glycyltransferase (peptidoglycan interpeptide bridge formation enzyme)
MGMVLSQNGRAYRTLLLDLDRPLDDIRKGLAQKWRNCLNASEREGLSVRWASDSKAFSQFRVNHESFVESKAFVVDLDANFYESVRNQTNNDAALELALVEVDGRPVASHLGSYLGDTAVYLLGFTEDVALSKKAAYFLHWEVIKRAKQRGMKWYDLGGIDPEENPGVFKFKSGFSGIDVSAAGPMQFGPDPLRSSLLRCIEGVRRLRK